MARILVYSGPLKGKSVELPADRRVVLGRSKTSDVRFPDRNMSRQHCAIWHGSSGYMVEDLESTNGTYLNGTRIKNAVLKDGDRLKTGDTEVEFRARERFDDSETKHDLRPVPAARPSGFEEAQTDGEIEIVPMEELPPAVVRRPRIQFCEACDVSIPVRDFESGAAKSWNGKLYCKDCARKEGVLGGLSRAGLEDEG